MPIELDDVERRAILLEMKILLETWHKRFGFLEKQRPTISIKKLEKLIEKLKK